MNQWKELKKKVRECDRCRIRQHCSTTVFGAGFSNARIVVVGEAPGAKEDENGKPFQGRAGKLMKHWFYDLLDWSPTELFVTNILKCRPPGNRDPLIEEKKNCREYLDAQLDFIKPKGILFVGRISANELLGTTHSAGKLRSQWWEYKGIPAKCIYHPAFILRPNGAPFEERTLDDLREFKKRIDSL